MSRLAPEAPFASADATGQPRFRGHLHLTAARREDGRTMLAHQSFRAPFHISKPHWDGNALHVQVVNPTAGILEGDELDMDIRVRSGAVLRVTTPAAARAFMMCSGAAVCRQQFTVEAGGLLEYTPEALCPHRDCTFRQETILEAEDGAGVFLADTLAPGRVARGESWAWRSLLIRLAVRSGGRPVLTEVLDVGGKDMARAAKFFQTPSGWFVTVVALLPPPAREGFSPDALRSLHRGAFKVGVSELAGTGWIVRAIVPDGQGARDLVNEVRERLAERLMVLRSDPRRV